MRSIALLFALIYICHHVDAQTDWQWTQLSPLPITTTGNSVCEAIQANQKYVYSFGGMSDSLLPSKIHKRVFKYKVNEDEWYEVASVPDSIGKLDFQTSFVNNRIYLIGGRYILEDSSEFVSQNVNVFNIALDTFEVNASPLPIPVHGHVQSVWRDSLIFVISGFDGVQNIPEVQIFNPYFNSWTTGTSIPDNDDYKALGASGYIIKDTIFYLGGATLSSTPQVVKKLRKGIINPDDPTQINWTTLNPNPQNSQFSGAASGHNNTVFWIGGSEEYHEFNLTKYDTNIVATGTHQIMEYSKSSLFSPSYQYKTTPFQVRNIRGIAKLGGGNWIIAGGVDSLNHVSNRTFLLHNSNLADLSKAIQPPLFNVNESNDFYIASTENIGEIIVYNISGKILYRSKKHLYDLYIPKSELTKGILLFAYEDGFNLPVVIKKVNP